MENKVWFARRPKHWVLLYSQTFRENDDPMIGFPTGSRGVHLMNLTNLMHPARRCVVGRVPLTDSSAARALGHAELPHAYLVGKRSDSASWHRGFDVSCWRAVGWLRLGFIADRPL